MSRRNQPAATHRTGRPGDGFYAYELAIFRDEDTWPQADLSVIADEVLAVEDPDSGYLSYTVDVVRCAGRWWVVETDYAHGHATRLPLEDQSDALWLAQQRASLLELEPA